MKVLVKNSWHLTEETLEVNSLEEALSEIQARTEYTAANCAEFEIEDDWKNYYDNFEEAFNSTYRAIRDQLASEYSFEVLSDDIRNEKEKVR